jgi:hypothetical protein
VPTYVYQCLDGHYFERILRVADYKEPQVCECGMSATKIISAATVFASPDVCDDSPVTGKPITSMKARLDDLARSHCTPYDPEIKKDYTRRIEREQLQLERSVEATVEATIEQMPVRKREQLETELRSGADCAPERQAAPFVSTTKVQHGH